MKHKYWSYALSLNVPLFSQITTIGLGQVIELLLSDDEMCHQHSVCEMYEQMRSTHLTSTRRVEELESFNSITETVEDIHAYIYMQSLILERAYVDRQSGLEPDVSSVILYMPAIFLPNGRA